MKKRKIGYLLLIIALFSLGIGFLFLVKQNKNTKFFTTEWKTYIGESLNNKKEEEYDLKEFYTNTFYSTKESKTIKHNFYCPIDSGYTEINQLNNNINNTIITIIYKEIDIENIEDYVNNLSNQNDKKDIFVEGKVIDNEITPIYMIHETSILKDNNISEERILLLTNNEYSTYSLLEYKIYNYKLSKYLIQKIERNYKLEYSNNFSCKDNTCIFDYSKDANINKKITIENSLKSFEEYSVSKKDNSIITLMNVKDNNKTIDSDTITIRILYNKKLNIKDKISFFNPNIVVEEVEINNKNLLKYNYKYNKDSKKYRTNYYYLIEDDLAIEYSIISKDDNTDKLVEQLLNITIN